MRLAPEIRGDLPLWPVPGPQAETMLVQPLAAYLRALPQALVADPGPASRCHGCDLVAALAAEAAPFRAGFIAYSHLPDGRNGSADGLAGDCLHVLYAVYASVTDEHARPGNQSFHVLLVLPAERASLELVRACAALAPASAPPGRFYNLMYALMAQAEGLCDLAKRCARELESAHRPVELGARDLSCLFGLDDPGLGCLGSVEQVYIERHSSTVPRQKTNVNGRAAGEVRRARSGPCLRPGPCRQARSVGRGLQCSRVGPGLWGGRPG